MIEDVFKHGVGAPKIKASAVQESSDTSWVVIKQGVGRKTRGRSEGVLSPSLATRHRPRFVLIMKRDSSREDPSGQGRCETVETGC